MPTVSVLMVFHRDTPFLRPAIASVFGQTFSDLELVLVDNGTGLAPESLGPPGSDPRVRWVRLARNEGIAAGHNAGVRAARGEFVALLDYDDVARPRRLEVQLARLRSSPQIALVSSLAEAITEHGSVLGREFAVSGWEAQRRYSQFAAPFFTPACTGRRELFESLPYRADFECCADFDFVTRVLDRSETALVEEVLLQYRHHPGQTTVERVGRIAAERCAVRLLTARRRSGRAESGEVMPIPAVAMAPVATGAWYAERCRVEGFAVLAAYHARRVAAEGRSAGAALTALRLFLRGWHVAPAVERGAALRMFLSGPVRALGLRAAESRNAGPAAG